MTRRYWKTADMPPPFEQPERRVLRDNFGSSGKTVQTNTASSPWAPTQPYLQQIFGGAQGLYNSGNYIAPQSPYSVQGQQALAARGAAGSPVTDASNRNLTDTLNGKYLDPSSNQYLSQSVNDALGLAKSQYLGLYGGNAGSQLSNSGFQEGLARNLGNTALPIYAQNYTNERNNQMQAAAMAPNAAASDYQNINAILQAGGLQEARGQAQIDAPWQALARYQQALSGNYGGQSTTQSPYFTNPLSTLLGLGLGGASLYKGLGGGNLFGGDTGTGNVLDTSAGNFYGADVGGVGGAPY